VLGAAFQAATASFEPASRGVNLALQILNLGDRPFGHQGEQPGISGIDLPAQLRQRLVHALKVGESMAELIRRTHNVTLELPFRLRGRSVAVLK